VQAVRHLIAQRPIAVLICAAALLFKLLVPTGYMVGGDHGRIAVTVCTGLSSPTTTIEIPRWSGDIAALHGPTSDHGSTKDHGKTEMPCGYAGLSAKALGAADPVLLLVALAIVAAMALRPISRPAPHSAAHLRPPLRGPPVRLI
jgi:hypothetical protein